jgi:hypothetical protein
MKITLIFLLSVLSVSARSQVVPAPATAKVNGACNIANVGNNNKMVIQCGIGRTQAQRMVEILNRVLASQVDPSVVMAKLDEILETAKEGKVQQLTTGPNSPNIAGNGNSVTYSNTSELPSLSRAQLQSIKDQLSSMKYRVMVSWYGSDSEASAFGDDLCSALTAAGWNVDSEFGYGGSGIHMSVPIAIQVNGSSVSLEAIALQRTLRSVLGIPVPGSFDASIPVGEIRVFLLSHPIRRLQ